MKVGNLVVPKDESAMVGFDYGIGTILERLEYPENAPKGGAVSYKVKWRHESQFWFEEELILVAE